MAINNALLELMERHIFSEVWLKRIVGLKIDESVLDCQNQNLIKKLEENGITVNAKYYNYHNVVGLIVVTTETTINQTNYRYVSIKTGYDLNRTLFSVIGEGVGGLYSMIEVIGRLSSLEEEIIGDAMHCIKYADKSKLPIDFMEFLLEYSETLSTIDFQDGMSQHSIKQWLIDNNHNVFLCDITTSDVLDESLYAYRAVSNTLHFLEDDFKDYKCMSMKGDEQEFVNRSYHPIA